MGFYKGLKKLAKKAIKQVTKKVEFGETTKYKALLAKSNKRKQLESMLRKMGIKGELGDF